MENFPAGSVKAQMKAEAMDSALSFEVKRHSEWMQLRFDYGKPRTWRQIVVRDPEGRLRYTHFDVVEPRITLLHREPDLTGATAVAGDIMPGRWTVEFLRNYPGQFELEWVIGDGPVPGKADIRDADRNVWSEGEEAGRNAELNRYDWNVCRETGRRWYKGDLHGHTTLSDGSLSPREMTRQAEARGLDFFFVTEHNVLPASWPNGKPLVIPGMEFTSFGKGDWNALGLPGWIDCWGTGLEDGGMHTQEGQNRMMAEAAERGAVRTFNHPLAGKFAWRYPESPLSFIDLLEIWNSPTKTSTPGLTEKTMVLWNLLWNDGYRIPGVGGSDTHLRPDQSYEEGCPPDTIGDPASYVLADRLTPTDILNGLRAGHVYVTRGPEFEMCIEAGDRTFTFGDDLTEALAGSEDGLVRCRLTVMHAKGAKLCVVENGEVIDTQPIEMDRWELEQAFSWKERTYVWRRLEIRDADGLLLCFTNPVSSGTREHELHTWGHLLNKAGIALETLV